MSDNNSDNQNTQNTSESNNGENSSANRDAVNYTNRMYPRQNYHPPRFNSRCNGGLEYKYVMSIILCFFILFIIFIAWYTYSSNSRSIDALVRIGNNRNMPYMSPQLSPYSSSPQQYYPQSRGYDYDYDYGRR